MDKNVAKKRRTLIGVVSKLPKDKTMGVRVEIKFAHPKYGKTVKEHKNYLAHFEGNDELALGDQVVIGETRPISKRKSWAYISKVEKK